MNYNQTRNNVNEQVTNTNENIWDNLYFEVKKSQDSGPIKRLYQEKNMIRLLFKIILWFVWCKVIYNIEVLLCFLQYEWN